MAERRKRPPADRVCEPGVPYGKAPARLAAEVLEVLQSDVAVRTQIAALLGIPAGLPEALHRVADELRAEREASERRFGALTDELRAQREESDKRFAATTGELRGQREASERRFGALTDELRAQREESDKRFEVMDRRFEELRADMDARFAEARADMDARLEELRADMDARFAEARADMNARFAEARADMNARFEAIDKRFDIVEGRLSLATLNIGRFVDHAGHRLEDVVAGAMRFALHRPDIRPDNVRLRQEFTDSEGKLGEKGRKIEIDVVAADGMTYFLEAKASAKPRDVRALAEDAEFAAKMMGLAPGKYAAVLATVDQSETVAEACRAHRVILI